MNNMNFDMIYNGKMFANKEFLYEHIFENMVLNNRGEEFGTTLVLTKNEMLHSDIAEALRKVKGVEVKTHSFSRCRSYIDYQYRIPRTDKMSVNKVEILDITDNNLEDTRGYRYRTIILDIDKEYINNMNKEQWIRIHSGHRPIENNYTDAKIWIY